MNWKNAKTLLTEQCTRTMNDNGGGWFQSPSFRIEQEEDMSGFEERLDLYLERQEKLHAKGFQTERSAVQSGHEFAMLASYRNDDPRFLLGVPGTLRRDSLCSEYCFFESCEELTEERLNDLLELADRVRDELTDYRSPAHKYTMVGLVICTDTLAPKLKKQVQRFSSIKRYEPQGNGWSEIRLCAVELNTGEIACNKEGKALKHRLTSDEEKKPEGFFGRLFHE